MLRPRFELAIENTALRQQLAVLKQNKPRPKLSNSDRIVWVTLCRRITARRIGIDVGMGDPSFGEPSRVLQDDTLDFAGIPAATLLTYPVVTHIAEKLHAYTMLRFFRVDRKSVCEQATAGKMSHNRLDWHYVFSRRALVAWTGDSGI